MIFYIIFSLQNTVTFIT